MRAGGIAGANADISYYIVPPKRLYVQLGSILTINLYLELISAYGDLEIQGLL